MRKLALLGVLVLLTICQSANAQPAEVQLRLEYKFPPPDSLAPDYYFAHITDIELLNDGLIAVLDQRQNSLFVVDQQGELVSTVGQKGQGPGEFSWPWEVEYDDANRLLWVMDAGRLQAFHRDGFSFSHSLRPAEVRPRDVVALNGDLYISGTSAHVEPLVYRYSSEGEQLGTLGTHIQREVGRYGQALYKMGDLAGVAQGPGSLRFFYAYSMFNDIIVLDDNSQRVVHCDYPTIVEQDAENTRKAEDWPDPDDGPTPLILIGDIFPVSDRLFVSVVYGTHQKETPILELDLQGRVQRIWRVPADYLGVRAFAVQMQGDEPVFWVGWSSLRETSIGRFVRR